MKKYSLLFYKGNSFVSKIIKLFTKSDYSHVAMVLDEYHVIETDWRFPVSIRHIKYNKTDYHIYHLNIELTQEQEECIKKFIYEEIDKKYDLKFFFTRWFKIMFDCKTYDDVNAYTCDDLIYEAFLRAGIKLVENKDEMTPQTLANSMYLEKE